MNRWLIFLKERLPIPVLLLLSFGTGLSTLALDKIEVPFLIKVFCILQPGLFLLTLRFMDEVKDFEKDKIVHPSRPLPRGLLTVSEVTRAIYLGLFLMLVLAVALIFAAKSLAGFLYGATIVYLWLMYKEFFVGKQLEKSPFTYALTHQVIMLLLAGAMRALKSESFNLSLLLEPGLMFMGAFFSYEICRKLDPEAHPALKTYRHHYGEAKTLYLLIFTSLLTSLGSLLLFGSSSISFYSLSLINLIVLLGYKFLLKKSYKTVEGLATLSLLFHIWWSFARSIFGD